MEFETCWMSLRLSVLWLKRGRQMFWHAREYSLHSRNSHSEPGIRFAPPGDQDHECAAWIYAPGIRPRPAIDDGLRKSAFLRHSRLVLSRMARLFCVGHFANVRFASTVE